jgi:hypothetical protein
VSSLMKLKQFRKFDSAASALEEASALTEGKVRIIAREHVVFACPLTAQLRSHPCSQTCSAI